MNPDVWFEASKVRVTLTFLGDFIIVFSNCAVAYHHYRVILSLTGITVSVF